LSADIMVEETKKTTTVEFKRLGYRLVVVTSADGLECSCIYDPAISGSPLTLGELQTFLSEAKVREGIDENALNTMIEKAEARQSVNGLLIAQGVPMVPGEDGRFDFAVQDSMADDEPENDDDQIDFRNIQQFLNVTSGQLIGTLIEPGEGIAGKTVSGNDIPALAGKELKIRAGKHVRLENSAVYSEADGRVSYRGEEISVEETYSVKGNVDFKVGNINYNGFLEVSGDVLDGFTVKATKGIKISGNIGSCTVESDGDISLCGMAGQEKGSIRCGGVITAKFLHDTKIVCENDILVETEIRNCDIKSLGIVRVNKGVLVGGTCIAMGGVESSTIGSPTSVFTRIVTGVNYNDLDELNRLFNELKKVLEDFKNSKDRSNATTLMKQRTAITEGIQELRSRYYEKANPKVNVKKKLFEKVNITLAKISEEIKEERSGPLSIIANTVEGGIRFLSMTDLSVKADEIEAIYVQEAERAKQTSEEAGVAS
jgi:uncharacterized protein (DUF342 family)